VSPDENKRLVRRFYEEVVSTADVDQLARYVSPDCVEVDDDGRHASGLAGMREHILGVHKTYSGFHLAVGQQIAEGEWVVTRVTASGTHAGVWLGMKPIRMQGVNIDRVIDGRIVEHGGAANLLGPLLEIGAIKIADPVSP
jgi:predicted ester cyclase